MGTGPPLDKEEGQEIVANVQLSDDQPELPVDELEKGGNLKTFETEPYKSANVTNSKGCQSSDETVLDSGTKKSDQTVEQDSDKIGSPASGEVPCQMTEENAEVAQQISDEISAQISDEICNQVSDEISQQISEQISKEISDQIDKQISDQIDKQISDQIDEQNPDLPSQEISDTENSEDAGAEAAQQDLMDNPTDNPDPQGSIEVRFEGPSQATLRLVAQSKIASHDENISLADLKCLSRKFNLDIAPKLLFARGSLIELLINANISHYSEFRTAERILTFKDNEIAQVPCSRADVFSSEAVNVMEKRVLMKFLSFCVTYDENPQEYEAFADKPFQEFLTYKKLSSNLQHYVMHAIAMVKENVDTLTGLREAQRFITSLGRYSNSPFVWTAYGMGELPQAFCRMSAVFGGLYCLRRSAKSLKIDKEENSFNAIVCTENQEISAKYIIIENSYLPMLYSSPPQAFVSRAILITDGSLKESTEEHVTLLTVPPGNGIQNSVRIIEIGPSSMACPVGLFVVHMTVTGDGTAEENLQPVVDLLFEVEKIEGDFTLYCFVFLRLFLALMSNLLFKSCIVSLNFTTTDILSVTISFFSTKKR